MVGYHLQARERAIIWWVCWKISLPLLEIVLLLSFGSPACVARLAFMLWMRHHDNSHGPSSHFVRSINYVGAEMAVVGTKVIALRYGFIFIAATLHKSGTFLEHLSRKINFTTIGTYYIPFATIVVFHLSRNLFKYLVVGWVIPRLSILVYNAHLMLDGVEAASSQPIKRISRRNGAK